MCFVFLCAISCDLLCYFPRFLCIFAAVQRRSVVVRVTLMFCNATSSFPFITRTHTKGEPQFSSASAPYPFWLENSHCGIIRSNSSPPQWPLTFVRPDEGRALFIFIFTFDFSTFTSYMYLYCCLCIADAVSLLAAQLLKLIKICLQQHVQMRRTQ